MNFSGLTNRARSAIGTEPQTETDPTNDASVDEVLSELANERRRVVVSHLYNDYNAEDSVTLSDLAEYLAHYEHGPEYSTDDRKKAYVGLYQSHLERLELAGLIEWVDGTAGEPKPGNHADAHTIRPGPNLEAAARILQTAESVCGGDS